MTTVTSRPSVTRLSADRARLSNELAERLGDGLQLDTDKPVGRREPTLALVNRVVVLDERISEAKVELGEDEVDHTHHVVKALALALSLMPPGCHEASRMLADAIATELRRARAARLALEHRRET